MLALQRRGHIARKARCTATTIVSYASRLAAVVHGGVIKGCLMQIAPLFGA